MGWSIGYDSRWKRDVGYGVPAKCDHPRCEEKIDRGLAYVCGGQPYGGDDGCGLCFCEQHHGRSGGYLCERCEKGWRPFAAKPDHQEWIAFKLKDRSWAKWRRENPAWVKANSAAAGPA